MSIYIAVTTGETVTPAQLIGEGDVERADKLSEAQRAANLLEKKMRALQKSPKPEGGTWREA